MHAAEAPPRSCFVATSHAHTHVNHTRAPSGSSARPVSCRLPCRSSPPLAAVAPAPPPRSALLLRHGHPRAGAAEAEHKRTRGAALHDGHGVEGEAASGASAHARADSARLSVRCTSHPLLLL